MHYTCHVASTAAPFGTTPIPFGGGGSGGSGGSGPGSQSGESVDGSGIDIEENGGDEGIGGASAEKGDTTSSLPMAPVILPRTSPPPPSVIEPVDIVVVSAVSTSIGICGEYCHWICIRDRRRLEYRDMPSC